MCSLAVRCSCQLACATLAAPPTPHSQAHAGGSQGRQRQMLPTPPIPPPDPPLSCAAKHTPVPPSDGAAKASLTLGLVVPVRKPQDPRVGCAVLCAVLCCCVCCC